MINLAITIFLVKSFGGWTLNGVCAFLSDGLAFHMELSATASYVKHQIKGEEFELFFPKSVSRSVKSNALEDSRCFTDNLNMIWIMEWISDRSGCHS